MLASMIPAVWFSGPVVVIALAFGLYHALTTD